MFGVLLSALGALFVEISSSIGKFEVARNEENPYVIPFLNFKISIFVFLVIAFINPSLFSFSIKSLPFFLTRFFMEVLVAYFMVKAIVTNERSTSSFILILTLPLLFLVDIFLGYRLSAYQYAGIIVIVLSLVALFINRDFDKRNAHYSVLAALFAVVTTSLYKYDITHFNSVVAEQIIMQALLLVFFFFVVWKSSGQNPFSYTKKPMLILQSSMHGVGNIVESFAYIFAPASVIVAAKRAASVFWAILSGSHYFHEKHILLKLVAFAVLLSGLVLLAWQ